MIPVDVRPEWLEEKPIPIPEERRFNEVPIIVWSGRVKLDRLNAWQDNPRLEIPIEQWKDENLGREPNNEDLLDIMLDYSVNPTGNDEEDEEDEEDTRRNRRNALVEMAESIRRNGIRVPIIVTHDRRILDGNRRYLANLYLYRSTDNEQERKKYESLPVWALPATIERSDEDTVLTELNAINDCTVKWPYYITAKRIFEHYKGGNSVEELQKKYHNYTKGRIKTIIEAFRVAAEFIEYHEDSPEAKEKAYRKLIWFDELRRSNGKAIEKADFREGIYDLILHPYSPFSSHADFRRLEAIYDNPEAWKVLTTSGDKEALKKAQFVLDRERYEGKSDAVSKMKRVLDLLVGIADGPGFAALEPVTLRTFHDLAAKVPAPHLDANARAGRLMDLLDGLTSKEIASLPKDAVKKLSVVAERVKKQAESYKED